MHRIAGLVIAAVVLGGCREAPSGAAGASQPRWTGAEPSQVLASELGPYRVQQLVAGLEHPWGLAFLPDGRMLVTERPGRLRLITPEGLVSAPISGLPAVYVEGQAGLLDVAVSPDFDSDGRVYVAFAEPTFRGNKAGTAVARGRLEGNALAEVEVIYRQEPKLSHGTHVGSRLVFDRQGMLFVTQGDNRVAAESAQELGSLVGKLVRIQPDGAVAAGNPFSGRTGARPEIWSYGHRNMQGAAVHPMTGKIWTSEHGPMGGDELNIPRAGGNYGWPRATHGLDYSGSPVPGSVGKAVQGMDPPHHVWPVSPGLSGMAFYTASLLPAWKGNLFLGALASKNLIRLELDGDRVVHEERLLGDLDHRVRDVRQGPDGALYVLTDAADGTLLRISPP